MLSFGRPCFPPLSQADEHGLVLVGGRLNVPWLLAAYREGIFPWPSFDGRRQILAWFSPDPRAIIELERFHASRSLLRRLRKGTFRVTIDRDFGGVIRGCARRGDGLPSWITPQLLRAYEDLHAAGHAHSVETWFGDELVGGVYGVAVGGYFSGESMFHRMSDASNVALYHLVRHLRLCGFELFDIQQWSEHTGRLGASVIPRREFLTRLARAQQRPVEFRRELVPD